MLCFCFCLPIISFVVSLLFFTLEIVSRKASGEVFGVDVSMMRSDCFVGRKFESVAIFRINKVRRGIDGCLGCLFLSSRYLIVYYSVVVCFCCLFSDQYQFSGCNGGAGLHLARLIFRSAYGYLYYVAVIAVHFLRA